MLRIDSEYIRRNGGFLHAVRKKCNRYLKALLEQESCIKTLDVPLEKFDRTIVHASPHLDEYFADLILRSVLPDHKMDIDFMEMAIHSKSDDISCKAYWPNACVIGIGGTVSGGVSPLLLFDEHLLKGKRSDESCSQMVIDFTLRPEIPSSIKKLLKEVNEIDSVGGAHDQHIKHIINTAHEVRMLLVGNAHDEDRISDWMNPEWKKTLMDSILTAIIYCLEHDINLERYPKEKETSLKKSLSHFIEYCSYKNDIFFKPTINRIKNIYLNQLVIFKNAKLPKSKKDDQLLILGRISFALEKCWGENIARIIMVHLWEVIYQGQYSFEHISAELRHLNADDGSFRNSFGHFEKRSLTVIHNSQTEEFWFFAVRSTPKLIKGNRAISNFINTHNKGRGIILIKNEFSCTQAIFKGRGVDQELWELFVDVINLEQECWHITHSDNGNYASFILNGNPSHRYVPQSTITLDGIINIFRNIL